ncbi:hypothetical protein L7F22_062541 [Adiantum nelumboides]|nr:hypothetical protein [Adiantum nelumboides]
MVKRKRLREQYESDDVDHGPPQADVLAERRGAEESSANSAAVELLNKEDKEESVNSVKEGDAKVVNDEELIDCEETGEEKAIVAESGQAQDGQDCAARVDGIVSRRRRIRCRQRRNRHNISASAAAADGETDVQSEFALAGMIFLCSKATKEDCFRYHVLGFPEAKQDTVEKLKRGMKLFLFDVNQKLLHGIFKANSDGGMNLVPEAFRTSERKFPAQVRFCISKDCTPLRESEFKDAIKDNYFGAHKFTGELSSEQVGKLMQIFCPINPRDAPQSGRKRGRNARDASRRARQRAPHEQVSVASVGRRLSARGSDPYLSQMGAHAPGPHMERGDQYSTHASHARPYKYPRASLRELSEHADNLLMHGRRLYSPPPVPFRSSLRSEHSRDYGMDNFRSRNDPFHRDVAGRSRYLPSTRGSYFRRG